MLKALGLVARAGLRAAAGKWTDGASDSESGSNLSDSEIDTGDRDDQDDFWG